MKVSKSKSVGSIPDMFYINLWFIAPSSFFATYQKSRKIILQMWRTHPQTPALSTIIICQSQDSSQTKYSIFKKNVKKYFYHHFYFTLPRAQQTKNLEKGCYCFTRKLWRWRDANNVSLIVNKAAICGFFYWEFLQLSYVWLIF